MSTSAMAIANLPYRYAELMDTGDLPSAAALFAHARVDAAPEPLDEAGLLELWPMMDEEYASVACGLDP